MGDEVIQAWVPDFGYLDIGEAKRTTMYVRNESRGLILDLEMRINPPTKRGVTAKMTTPRRVDWFPINETAQIDVEWYVSPENISAGHCRALISFRGFLTRE